METQSPETSQAEHEAVSDVWLLRYPNGGPWVAQDTLAGGYPLKSRTGVFGAYRWRSRDGARDYQRMFAERNFQLFRVTEFVVEHVASD